MHSWSLRDQHQLHTGAAKSRCCNDCWDKRVHHAALTRFWCAETGGVKYTEWLWCKCFIYKLSCNKMQYSAFYGFSNVFDILAGKPIALGGLQVQYAHVPCSWSSITLFRQVSATHRSEEMQSNLPGKCSSTCTNRLCRLWGNGEPPHPRGIL